MSTTGTEPPDAVVVAQGSIPAMRTLCDELRRGNVDAALVPPPGGCSTG